MKHFEMHETLTGIFNPLTLKVILLLYDRPHTRKELYAECSTWNNTLVKAAVSTWASRGIVTGGDSRGQPYRLTVKGHGLAEWLLEGSLVI